MRSETREVVDSFTLTHQFHGDRRFFLNSEHEPATGRTVQLGENKSRNPGLVEERTSLIESVLTGRRIEDE